MEQLLTLNKHEELLKLLSGAENSTQGINEIEIKHLAWLATQVPTGKDIIEIGTHRGKSICVMGTACLEAGNTTARLFGIDLWTTGKTTFAHYKSEETFEIFEAQVKKMGLTKMIRPVITSSLKAAKYRKNPIHLLFIDASHKYKDVLADYEAWHVFVPSGGRIAFHDYTPRFVGVTKTINEHVIPSGLWKDAHTYGRIWSAVRK